MSKILKGLAIFLSSLVSFIVVGGTASADVTLPNTQHWNAIAPWNGPNWGGPDLDPSTSAPGSPSTSIRYTYPSGYPGGGSPGSVGAIFVNPTSTIYVEYWFRYSSGWTKHEVLDKQTYIQINAPGEPDIIIGGGPWTASSISVSTETGLRAEWLYPNTGYNPNIYTGNWVKVTVRGTLNTPGVANGIIQVWINDGLVINYNNVILLESGYSGKWSRIEHTPVWGGMGGNKPKTEYFWVDYTVISTDPISSVSSPPPAIIGKSPTAPSNLIIQ